MIFAKYEKGGNREPFATREGLLTGCRGSENDPSVITKGYLETRMERVLLLDGRLHVRTLFINRSEIIERNSIPSNDVDETVKVVSYFDIPELPPRMVLR